jgi:hypothetical protein
MSEPKVRCKMMCVSKADSANQWQPDAPKKSTVKLAPVVDEANKTWAKYTPGGSIELQIDNPAAVDAFEIGAFYYVDFSRAPAGE